MISLEQTSRDIHNGYAYLRNFNLFPTVTAATDPPHRLRNQILSTRLFIVSLRLSASSYINSVVTPLVLFDSQMQSMSEQFESSTTNEFLSSLRIVRDIIEANYLLSGLQSNAYMWVPSNSIFVNSDARLYAGCSCAASATCVSSSTSYEPLDNRVFMRVRGMRTGCYLLEALLQFTLECFYDHSCFAELRSYLSSIIVWNGPTLDDSIASRISTNSTVDEMVKKLMVEEWQWRSEYSEYFDECRPVECRYMVKTRNDAIFIATTVIGVIGGLITALRLIVPCLVEFMSFLHRRGRPQRTTQVSVITSNNRPAMSYIRPSDT
jgi:hypothetical protein